MENHNHNLLNVPGNYSQDSASEYSTSTSASSVSEPETMASITSSVMHGTLAEGRRPYAVYGREEYGVPMDNKELSRMDLCHRKYVVMLGDQMYLAPIGDDPKKILDLGCGTGIWCIEMADKFPDAEVRGVDIAPTQPDWVPPNCIFEVDDIEQTWILPPSTADFIFCRDPITSVRDFPNLFRQAYEHLAPGGWIEMQSVVGMLGCDDDSIPPESSWHPFIRYMGDAYRLFGTPVEAPLEWKQQLEEGGFINVTERTFKIPSGPWPKDPQLRLVGMWEQYNLVDNIEGLLMRPFVRTLGWTEEQLFVFTAHLRRDLKDMNQHAWWPFKVVYAQKPMESGDTPTAEKAA